MRTEDREIYVISDLHIGGRYAERGRGFRICPRRGVEALASFVGGLRRAREAGREVELCIAGDFVDFLSEEHDGQSRFLPFIADQVEAARVLRTVIERDQPVPSACKAIITGALAITKQR